MLSIQPEDIAERIYYNNSPWNPYPEIKLIGEEGSFGELIFAFPFEFDTRQGGIIEKTRTYRIYIKNKQHIENCCQMAILNYDHFREKIVF